MGRRTKIAIGVGVVAVLALVIVPRVVAALALARASSLSGSSAGPPPMRPARMIVGLTETGAPVYGSGDQAADKARSPSGEKA